VSIVVTDLNQNQGEQKMRQSNDKGTPNIGTACKATLQEQALKFMQKYPKDRTAKQYANLLCWDIRVSRRTALESYIEPMIEHGILVYSGKKSLPLQP
jgi:hypothetical protein